MKKICLAGYSGHAYVIADIAKLLHYSLAGYIDIEEKNENPLQLQFLGYEDKIDFSLFIDNNINIALATGDNKIRSKIYDKFKVHNIKSETLVHPNASVSSSATINEGTVVMALAIVNPFAKIGKAVICNSSCVIEHECIISDYAHIAPGAVLAGNVRVGEFSFIGGNAFVKQGISVGSNAVIGAGSVVLHDVPDNAVVYGNPAKIKMS